jgi:uncharacterized membrane protein
MNATTLHWLDFVFRWAHVIAGVMWIGHLWFFNFVNAQVAKGYDADSKKKVVPQLMPRALYFFRWGAAYTFISGLLMLGMTIYAGGVMENGPMASGTASAIGLGSLPVAFLVYDALWKSPLGKNETTAGVVSFLLVAGLAYGLAMVMPPRAVMIHVGAILGTIMASNVWMRIWPSQRKIIAAIAEGKAPDAAIVGLAGLRSKHNTYMSMPLMFFMVSNHYPLAYGITMGGEKGMNMSWAVAAVVIAVGWGVTKFLFNKSAEKAPTEY